MSDDHRAIEPAEIETTATQLAERDERQLHPVIQAAISQRYDPSTLRELLAVQREFEAGEARRAYARALSAAKEELPPVIRRDAKNPHLKVAYATLGGISSVVTPILSRHGISVSWRTETEGREIVMICRLTHVDGHSEDFRTPPAPPDQGKGRSAVQAIGSTMTYLSRYSLLLALGLATGDAPDPDDGRSAPQSAAVDQRRNLRALSEIRRRGHTLEEAVAQCDGRDVAQWTPADLDRLRSWIRRAGQSPAPTPADGDVIEGEIEEES